MVRWSLGVAKKYQCPNFCESVESSLPEVNP